MQIRFDFCFQIDQNLIKNVSKNGIDFKVGFGLAIFSIFFDFWEILDQICLQNGRSKWWENVRRNFPDPWLDIKGFFSSILDPETTKNVIWPQQNALWCPFWMWKTKIFATRFLTSLPFFNQKGPLGVQNWYQMTTFALAGTPFSRVSER